MKEHQIKILARVLPLIVGTTAVLLALPRLDLPQITGTTLFSAGLVLLVLGFRGRVISDHPHCAKCGFDLFGSLKATNCPECGNRLFFGIRKSVLPQKREVRRPLIAAGAVVILIPLVLVGVLIVGHFRNVDWNQYKPFWVLLNDAADNNVLAMTELDRRSLAGELSRGQRDRLVEKALEVQSNTGLPWSHNWTQFVMRACRRGELSAADEMRYLMQSWSPKLVVRRRVRYGDPLPFEVAWEYRGGPFLEVSLYPDYKKISIDGGSWVSPDRTDQIDSFFYALTRFSVDSESPILTSLEPGKHQIEMKVAFEAESSLLGSAVPRRRSKPKIFTLQGSFVVVDSNEKTILPVQDKDLRMTATKALWKVVKSMGLDPENPSNWGGCSGNMDALPIPLCFDVFSRTTDTERHLGEFSSIGAGFRFEKDPTWKPSGQGVVDLVFRPSPALAVNSVDVTRYLDEEIVLKDVPMRR